MLNNQDFMEFGWRNNVGSLPVKDQSVSERVRSDEDRLINGLQWNHEYFGHDRTDIHVQIVPELHKQEDKSEKDLLVAVPDDHSETGDYHLSEDDYSDSSDSRWFLSKKHENPKRRRIQISSDDEESEGFTREVPSVTRKGSKKRRRRNEMSNQMRTLQQLVPNCHKTDKVSVLDKTIEYMKNLQLQLQVMSIMRMNPPYIPPATFDFGMHNHLLMAMAMAQGQNPANQTMLSPFLPPFTNPSFPHLVTRAPSPSPQPIYGLVPCFPGFIDFSPHYRM